MWVEPVSILKRNAQRITKIIYRNMIAVACYVVIKLYKKINVSINNLSTKMNNISHMLFTNNITLEIIH